MTFKFKRFVYFIRKTQKGVPIFDTNEETAAHMSDYLYAGTCSRRILTSMLQTTQKSLLPLIEAQFREPVMIQASEMDLLNVHLKTAEPTNSTSQLAFNRPSDYRRLSMIISKETNNFTTTQETSSRVQNLTKDLSTIIELKRVVSVKKVDGIARRSGTPGVVDDNQNADSDHKFPLKKDLMRDVTTLETSISW